MNPAASSVAAPARTISVVVVNYNTKHLLEQMFHSLRQAAARFRIKCVLIDNASRDESAAYVVARFPDVHLIRAESNVGFGRGNNLALPYLAGSYVLLLNTDAFVSPDTLDKTIAYMDAHPRCGILGVRLVGRHGEPQPCARFFPTPARLFASRTGLDRVIPKLGTPSEVIPTETTAVQCDWVPGCYYLIRRDVIDQIGLFDPRYFLYFEEVDHCRAAKTAGWEVVFYGDTTVVHLGGESAKSAGAITVQGRQLEPLQIESELLYFRKNHGLGMTWAHILLTILGDAIVATKSLARGRFNCLGVGARHALLACQLFMRTRFGRCPTR